MYLSSANNADLEAVERAFQELESEGRERLEHEDVPDAQMAFQRFMDMRYQGQWRSMSVAVRTPLGSIDEAIQEFHAEHGREHNYRRDDSPVEIYRLSVRATGITPKPSMTPRRGGSTQVAPPTAVRRVLYDQFEEHIDTPIYSRADLGCGDEIAGPAIIEQLDSTTVVPPACRATVDAWLNIRIAMPEVQR
jgi:N-methylhydantoinase A